MDVVSEELDDKVVLEVDANGQIRYVSRPGLASESEIPSIAQESLVKT
jgi:hypothetical protein